MDLLKHEKLFLVGGIEDMGGANMRANPAIKKPNTNCSAFPIDNGNSIEQKVSRSIVRVISNSSVDKKKLNEEILLDQRMKLTRTNFLPDSATRIFYPAWDVTYSGTEGKNQARFFATYGLGSPFVEDSKLCAAVNGMWAAASPDAARTFRNSLKDVPTGIGKAILPPTAIPLLDNEIGFHSESSAVKEYKKDPSTGWDGEEGPYIFIDSQQEILVNFVDIGRSDYVSNAIQGKFDMSLMRSITTKEIDFRMSCLKRCNDHALSTGIDLRSYYWMVGAEKVLDWRIGANGFCIPKTLYSDNNNWATKSKFEKPIDDSNNSGYLFLFVKTIGDFKWKEGTKRNTQQCDKLVICQVNAKEIAACIIRDSDRKPKWM